jgi:hypothetical protein
MLQTPWLSSKAQVTKVEEEEGDPSSKNKTQGCSKQKYRSLKLQMQI